MIRSLDALKPPLRFRSRIATLFLKSIGTFVMGDEAERRLAKSGFVRGPLMEALRRTPTTPWMRSQGRCHEMADGRRFVVSNAHFRSSGRQKTRPHTIHLRMIATRPTPSLRRVWRGGPQASLGEPPGEQTERESSGRRVRFWG
jgi:hypothetical protein